MEKVKSIILLHRQRKNLLFVNNNENENDIDIESDTIVVDVDFAIG